MALITDARAIEYLTLDYLDALDLMGRAVGQAIREVWNAMPAYDREQLAEFIEQAQPLARAGAVEGAELAGAYLAEVKGAIPAAVDIDLEAVLPALDAPFLRYWHNIKEGQTWEQSVDSGGTQAEFVGYDSTAGGADHRMGSPGTKVIAYQRVISASACEWCRVVATQLYKTAQSANRARHKNCGCRVVAVTEENALAVRKINRRRLKDLRQSGAVQRATEARERNRERAREVARSLQ